MLKNDYPQFGGSFEVIYHSELISHLIEDGKLKLNSNGDLGKIVLHDSCYLDHYNGVYDAPRSVIAQASGRAPAEMPRDRRNSSSCGAGGGRMWMGERIGKRINLERVGQSLALEPKTVCVCCPYCLIMFEDGLKDKQADANVKVLDIAEIVVRAIVP
jgi:Fe-S oxidoreductase